MSENEAIEYYYKTGQHLGVFENPESATTYAITLHNDQDRYYNSIGCPITIGLNNQTFTLSVNEAGQLEIKASDINIKGDKINISGGNINLGNNTTIDNKLFLTHTHSNGNLGEPTGGVI